MNIQKGTIRYWYGRREYGLSFRVGSFARAPGMEVSSELIHLDHGWRITVALTPQGSVNVREAFLEANYRFTSDDRIFCNGYQSRTESREYAPHERMGRLARSARRFKVDCSGDYQFYPYTGRRGMLHSHVYCYIRQKTGDLTLLGSLMEETGYTIYACETRKNRIQIIKEVEGLVIADRYPLMDIFQLQGPEREVLQLYFETLCPGLQTREPATGWSSWYKYHANISEDIILDNLNSLSRNRIPIDFFLIDDGYQAAVGDWLAIKPGFPQGMKRIADSVRAKGYRPGLWLAPFICEERSKITKDHPDWLLTTESGPVPAGWNPHWSGTFHALDVYNDEFLYYIREVFDTVLNRWGFDMVKLDFLYAAAMIPRSGTTRGTIMSDAMRFLRRCAGDKIILGCGVPLGSAFGRVDYCRIGSDTAPKWDDLLLATIHNRERVSTANSLASTIGRSHLNGRVFMNDPDAVILREEDNSLSKDQRYTLFMLNNIFGGILFTSDSISVYPPETMHLYRSMFPFLKKKEDIRMTETGGLLRITFHIGANSYFAFANLSPRRAKGMLDNGLFFFACNDEDSRFIPGGTAISLLPYESRCYLSVNEEFFTVSGTTAHLFPGSEIISCVQKGDTISIIQHEQVRNRNTVYIRTPGVGQYFINGIPVHAEKIREKLFILNIEL